MTNAGDALNAPSFDETMMAFNVVLHVATRSLNEVEDIVNPAQLQTLTLIAYSGSESIIGLADQLNVDPHKARRLCADLVESRLVYQHRKASDEPLEKFSATADGEKLVEHVRLHTEHSLRTILNRLTDDQRAQVSNALVAFAQAAGAGAAEDGRFVFGLGRAGGRNL